MLLHRSPMLLLSAFRVKEFIGHLPAESVAEVNKSGELPVVTAVPVPALANNLRVNLGAGTQLARLGLGIELEQAEAKVPAFVPFKVVGQAPVKVATQVGAFLEQGANLICGGLQDPGANTVGAIGDAVFQDVDRLFETGESFHGAA